MPDFRVASHDFDFTLADFDKEFVANNDDEYILEFLSSIGASDIGIYKGFRIVSDLDKDGEDEYIYTVDNFSLTAIDYTPKGYMFVVDNDKIVYSLDGKQNMFSVIEIMDLNGDGTSEIIVGKNNRDLNNFASCYQFYNFKNNRLVLQKDCK